MERISATAAEETPQPGTSLRCRRSTAPYSVTIETDSGSCPSPPHLQLRMTMGLRPGSNSLAADRTITGHDIRGELFLVSQKVPQHILQVPVWASGICCSFLYLLTLFGAAAVGDPSTLAPLTDPE